MESIFFGFVIVMIVTYLLHRDFSDYSGHQHEQETRDGWYYNYGTHVEFVSKERLIK